MIKKLAIVRRQLSLWNESFLKGEGEKVKKKALKDKVPKRIEEEKEDLFEFNREKEYKMKRRKLEER